MAAEELAKKGLAEEPGKNLFTEKLVSIIGKIAESITNFAMGRADQVVKSAESMEDFDFVGVIGVEKLWEFSDVLIERPDIENLSRELKRLQSLLRNRTLSLTEKLNSEDLTCDAKDVIEDIVYDIQKFQRVCRKIGSVDDWCARTDMRSKISWQLQSLTAQIRVFSARLLGSDKVLPTHPLDHDGASGDSDVLHPMISGQSFIDLENDPLVGIEDATKEVIFRLLEREKRFNIVCICGVGGIGKTTLAKSVFQDTSVRQQFHCIAWVHVGDSFITRRVLEDVLMSITSHKWEEMIPYTDSELAEMLYNFLQRKRYLIVLDDVSNDAWDCLCIAFPTSEETGSRLLLTTRSNEVAGKITASNKGNKGFTYQMRGLSDQQSWELFYMITFRAQSSDPRDDMQLTEVAKEILRKCSGLPLAIRVVGGLLASKRRPHEWRMVSQRFASSQTADQTPEDVTSVFTLAYNSLPYCLKRCFLYMGLFPKGAKVKTQQLYHLWSAEGLIIPFTDLSGEVSLMDIAERYLYELWTRGMVVVCQRKVPTGRRFKSCHLHDLMHDLCLSKLEEESFCVDIYSGCAHNANLSSHPSPVSTRRISRLALYFEDGCFVPQNWNLIKHFKSPPIGSELHNQQKSMLSGLQNLSRLRGLLLFPSNYRFLRLPMVHTLQFLTSMDLELLSGLGDLKRLRFLDCNGFNFDVRSLHHLMEKQRQLRYLDLSNCHIESLPSTINSLPSLEILCLPKCNKCSIVIPSELEQMSSLRHLFLPQHFEVKGASKLQMDGLKNLEMLVNFDSTLCEVKDLWKLTKLQNLVATIDGNKEDLAEICKSEKTKLKGFFSSLLVRMSDCYSKEVVIEDLWRCSNLHVLRIEGVIGSLPWRIPHSLTKLSFSGSMLDEDPMGKLEKLPNLQVLKLCNNAFVGKYMTCSVSGMPVLSHLTLLKLENLEKLAIEKGGMPTLLTLALERCQRLKDLPEGLSFLASLQKLEVLYMPSEFMGQLDKAGEDLPKEHAYIIKTNKLL